MPSLTTRDAPPPNDAYIDARVRSSERSGLVALLSLVGFATKNRRVTTWASVVLALGTCIAASARAAGAGGACEPEFIEMTDPVVTVIAGPGNAQDEQARWPEYSPEESYANFEEPGFVVLFGQGVDVDFTLEPTQ